MFCDELFWFNNVLYILYISIHSIFLNITKHFGSHVGNIFDYRLDIFLIVILHEIVWR